MINITEGQVDSFTSQAKQEMQGPIKHFEKEITSIRTGKATNSLVEGIMVDAYGQSMRLLEVAGINIPDARMIVIQPWDKGLLPEIQKAIQTSDLGINPVVDGDAIRLQMPMMSSERRDELVKTLHKRLEEARVGIRNVRRDFHNAVRDAEKAKSISEDFAKRLNDALQKTTDECIKQAEAVSGSKEAELKKV